MDWRKERNATKNGVAFFGAHKSLDKGFGQSDKDEV